MARKICVSNTKGGCGKTTICRCLSGELAKTYKKRVLLIDSDPSSNLSLSIETLNKPERLFAEMLTEYTDTGDLDDIRKGIVTTPFDGLEIAPGTRPALEALNKHMEDADFAINFIYRDVLSEIEDRYDYIIFDVSGGGGEGKNLSINSFVAADYILLPFSASLDSVHGYSDTMNRIKNLKRDNRQLEYLGTIFTDYKKSYSKDIIKEKVESLPGYVPIIFNHTENVENSRIVNKPLAYAYPNSIAAKNFAEITAYLIEKMDKLEGK